MLKSIILLAGTAVALSSCATRREALRADRIDARVQTAQCQDAKAYRGKRAQRVQCAQARDARQNLRETRNSPY